MKNILKIIICILFLSSMNVNASSYSMNLSGNTNVKVGEEVNVSVSLNNISDIPNGLNACQATLTSSGLSINSVSGNGWSAQHLGETLMLYDMSGSSVTSNSTIATIKVKVNSAGSITISNIECSDGENDYNAGSKTINFTIKEEGQNNNNNNTNNQTTTKRVETEKTTTIAKKSSLLKNLIIEDVEFEFNKNTYEYTIEVENNVDKLILNYETEDKNAKVEKVANEELIVGENKIDLIVSNEDSKTTYTLTIIRKDKITEVSNNETEILEALKQEIDVLKVRVDLNDTNKVITSNILKYLKENNKNIIYEIYENNKIIYSIKILGKNIDNTNEFNFNIRFNSNYINSLNEQLKNYNYKIINFDYRGLLPKDTEVILYNISLKDKVYLYNYNQNKDVIEFIEKIDNGNNIKLVLDKSSEYILTDYSDNQPINMIIILFILLVITIILLIIILVYKFKRKKKVQ